MSKYLVVYDTEDDEPLEVPMEEDETILLSTLSGVFPNSTGLKYKAETGLLRALRILDGKIFPPEGGWGDKKIFSVFPKDTKRKFSPSSSEMDSGEGSSTKLKRLEKKKCTDLIVLNLAWRTNEQDMKKHFETFGDLVTVQIKRDPATQNSKGYGFIRFANYESQLLCLAEKHFIDGRWCDVKIPMSKGEGDKQEVSRKIHVGRVSEDITTDQLRQTFERYGKVIDVFVPKPFRSFAFVTFEDPDVANGLLGQEIEITPQCVVLVGSAVPKLQPMNMANQKQMAVAMHAAACVAALNHAGWSGRHDEYPGPGPSRFMAPPNMPPPPPHQPHPHGMMFNGHHQANMTAAMLAAQYTRAHRQGNQRR